MVECRSPRNPQCHPTMHHLEIPDPATPPPPRPAAPDPGTSRTRARSHEAGQATAEYALVMLAAAALAGLLIAWAASTDGIGRLLDAVLDSIIADAG